MAEHKCGIPGCDGTRLGHDLARDFPAATARFDEAMDRLRRPDDHVRPENLTTTHNADEQEDA